MRGHLQTARSGAVGALILIGIGVLLLLHENGILRWNDVWRLWPLILVIGGLGRMSQYGSSSKVMGGLMIGLGILLGLAEFGVIPYTVRELWPLGIIALGLLLLWQSLGPRREIDASGAGFCMPPVSNNISIFGGGERRISTPDFAHAELVAIFGGYKLDLRKATMKGTSAVIDATAVFGGIEIVVPDTWNVIVRGVGIFGGYGDESHHPPASQPAPELIVQGVAIFGGVVTKN
jgi:hypothetical protein